MQGCSLQQWLTDKENKMGPLLTKMGGGEMTSSSLHSLKKQK